MGTLGQCMRKMNMASRLTTAHSMQKRMMPRQRRPSFLTKYPPRKVPPPPAGTTIKASGCTWACLSPSSQTVDRPPSPGSRPSSDGPPIHA
uniref:Uncharacterized protein n=1 Tax=Paramormyrops kingsleyae TaxID=1676925 RepID=A0A3B3RU82_9TELE